MRHTQWQLTMIDVHLAQCTHCSDDLRELSLAAAALRYASRNSKLSVATLRGKPDFSERVMRRVRKEEHASQAAVLRHRSIGAVLSLACCLTAALIMTGQGSTLHAREWWFPKVGTISPRQSDFHRNAPYQLHDPFSPPLSFAPATDVDMNRLSTGHGPVALTKTTDVAQPCVEGATKSQPISVETIVAHNAAEAMITAEAAERSRTVANTPSPAGARLASTGDSPTPAESVPIVLASSMQNSNPDSSTGYAPQTAGPSPVPDTPPTTAADPSTADSANPAQPASAGVPTAAQSPVNAPQ